MAPRPTRIILTGFMGTGKTAVGTILADKLGYVFLDTDTMVEKDAGILIAEIFEKQGEAKFREVETKMLRKALDKEKIVISTGGGSVIDPDNRSLMKQKGVVIALTASPEIIYQRISKVENRPLLKTKDVLGKIKTLISHRSEFYREADHIIDTTSHLLEQTVDEILKVIRAPHTR